MKTSYWFPSYFYSWTLTSLDFVFWWVNSESMSHPVGVLENGAIWLVLRQMPTCIASLTLFQFSPREFFHYRDLPLQNRNRGMSQLWMTKPGIGIIRKRTKINLIINWMVTYWYFISRMATERTFIAIKPDGVQRGLVGEIIKRFEQRGYKLVAMKLCRPGKEHLEKHYADLSSKVNIVISLDHINYKII